MSEVELVDDAEDYLDVSYTSHCSDGRVKPGSSQCTGLQIGETVSFDVKITARGCKPGRQKMKGQI